MKEITLSLEERQKLSKCPNCGSKSFTLKNTPTPNHPLKQFRQRPIYQCQTCGYWTDLFDGWNWHPPESLRGKGEGKNAGKFKRTTYEGYNTGK